MRKLFLIGIGSGHPEQLTLQAVRALQGLDVVFVLDKGELKQELSLVRKLICERYIERRDYRVIEVDDPVRDPAVPDYTTRVEAWHAQRASIFETLIARELQDDQSAGLLVWGDPALYDSTLRIVQAVQARGQISFEYTLIPGLGSIQALTASHRIALNRIGGSVLITTGRRLREQRDFERSDDVLVMLDGECSFKHVTGEWEIFWGAYLGSQHELLISGKLKDVTSEIERARSAARAQHGWIMDIYLLRKSGARTQATLDTPTPDR
jgi:precorrin-6A synthase